MANNFVNKISNAFSTGGGGTNFEQNIQALFLLSILVDGFCPVINEPTKKICFQAKHLGFDVDDLVVFTDRPQHEGKVLCQIKHSITVSERDKTFLEVITAAWSDFNKDCFDRNGDKIVLAAAKIAYSSMWSLRFLNEHAQGSIDEKEFLERVEQGNFSSDKNREILNIIKNCIKKANKNVEPTNCELWMFCKSLVLVLFDLDYSKSVNRTLAIILIKNKSKVDPSMVWSKLIDYAARCNQTAASIDINNIDPEITDIFQNHSLIIAPPKTLKTIDNFIPILTLIGAWNENNAFDKKIIESIAVCKYENFEAKARTMLTQSPDYLTLNNGVWKVRHKKLLFEQCAGLFFDDMINRLFDNAKTVFKQKNKCLESNTLYLMPSSSTHENSSELRHGMIDGMCMLKYTASKLCNCNIDALEEQGITFVKEILHDCDWIRWVSLKECLQDIAELEPNTFLAELEWNIIYKPKELLKLFPTSDGNILGSTNYISELLWSLETLSWSPDYVVSAVRCLGLLEALPYENTSWANTPISSIVSVLLPWYPQTMADCEKQKNALVGLKIDKPEVFWQVTMKLLPDQTSTTIDNPRPRYIPISIPETITVLNEKMLSQYKVNLELAIDVADDESKIAELVKVVEYMDEATLDIFLGKIEKMDLSYDEEKAFDVWLSLSDYLSDNVIGKKTIAYKHLDRIRTIVTKIEPKDIRISSKKLYLSDSHFFKDEDYIEKWKLLEEKKAQAVYDIYSEYGISDVELFGKKVNNLSDVGFKLGLKLSNSMMAEIIESYHRQEVSRDFFASCLNEFCRTSGISSLLKTSIESYEPEYIADILAMIPFVAEMENVISKLLPEDGIYWEKASFAYRYDDTEGSTLQLITEKLIQCKRYVTAVNVLGCSKFEKVITPADLCQLLKKTGTEESSGNEKIDSYATQHLIVWLQNQKEISLEVMSEIEFIYLPILEDFSRVEPKALRTRLGQDADYFCNMMELFYKRKSDTDSSRELNKELGKRLFKILFNFNVVPGTNRDGEFNENKFCDWMNSVTKWSKENDRYEVTMHTVGTGLSYSNPGGNGIPSEIIIKELNKPENEELRRGYLIGMSNQRGVHFVDPEGKPEFELSEKFGRMADEVERMGYSRYSEVLRSLSKQYKREAMHNIQEHKSEKQEE